MIKRSRFQEGEVVVFKNQRNKAIVSKVICETSYKTYKIKTYETKQFEYVNEYKLSPFEIDAIDFKSYDKKKKRMLKTAQKDQKIFLEQEKHERASFDDLKEEEDFQVSDSHEVSMEKYPELSKVKTFSKIKVEKLCQDFKEGGLTKVTYLNEKKQRVTEEYQTKFILITKLIIALEEISLDISDKNSEKLIEEIIDLELLEPLDYLCSEVYEKMKALIQSEKLKKGGKLKNKLIEKKEMIKKGFKAYVENYSVFLAAISQIEKIMDSYP